MASTSALSSRRGRTAGRAVAARAGLNLVASAGTGVVVAAGVWIAGGVVTDDYRTSMALTAVWLLASAATAFVIGRRLRPIRAGVWAGYVLAAAAIAVYLGATALRDRVVDEQVVTGVPVTRGDFVSREHSTTGTAAIVRLPDGRRFLTLTAFETSAGPDLRVRLVPGAGYDGGAGGAIDLGALKGNRGDQQYELPGDARVRDTTVVIWCRAFSAPFGSAQLRT